MKEVWTGYLESTKAMEKCCPVAFFMHEVFRLKINFFFSGDKDEAKRKSK